MTAVIGITSIPRRATTTFGEHPHETIPEFYAAMVTELGAIPVVLPVHTRPVPYVLDRLDGIMLSGGGDVDPSRYGRGQRPETGGIDPERDQFEIDLVRHAVDRDVPVLAICRGVQVMNVALGGTLIQDLRTQIGGKTAEIDHWDIERWDRASHPVRIEAGTRLAKWVGEELAVNSMHHQAIDDPAPALRPVGRSPDGVIEAVEMPDARFCAGVQWHPECLSLDDPSFALFRSYIEAAAGVHR